VLVFEHHLDNLFLGQKVGVLLERVVRQLVLLPKIRLQVTVCVPQSVEQGLDKVTHGPGVTPGGGVAIINTSHAQEALPGGGGHQTGTTRSRDEPDPDGSALTRHLRGDSVGHGCIPSPVPASDGGNIELSAEDGTSDGGGHLGGALDTKADMSRSVADSHKGLKSRALSSRTLLLNGHDFHDLVLELVLEEVVNDLGLLHGDGEEEDLLNAADLALLHEAAELSHRDPHVLLAVATATSAASATSPSAAPIATATVAAASSSKTSAFVRHDSSKISMTLTN